MEPEPPQDQRKDELGDQERLYDRDRPVVQRYCLEDEGSGQRHPPKEPQRAGYQIADESPTLGVFGVADAGNVLHDDVEGVGQRGQ